MKIIAIMGKAGSGKDTILQDIMARYPDRFNEIVSCTSRPPRQGEKEGVNYFYLSDEEFLEKVRNGDMLEYTNFNSWYYGTAKSVLSVDKINIGVFNPAGVKQLIANPAVDVKVAFITVDDKERLIRQLNREQYPNIKEIIRRYDADEKDFTPEVCSTIPCTCFSNNYAHDVKWCADKIVQWLCD